MPKPIVYGRNDLEKYAEKHQDLIYEMIKADIFQRLEPALLRQEKIKNDTSIDRNKTIAWEYLRRSIPYNKLYRAIAEEKSHLEKIKRPLPEASREEDAD